MGALERLRQRMEPGGVYRRADFVPEFGSVDRLLRQLVASDEVRKLRTGIYHRPKQSVFGKVPASDRDIVAAFLGNDDFMLVSLNSYNGLGVGTTQLYNYLIVYNHKRQGLFKLDGLSYHFLKNRKYPKKATEAFLLVDLMNNIKLLAEDLDAVKERVARRARDLGVERLVRAAGKYGSVSTKRYFASIQAQGVR